MISCSNHHSESVEDARKVAEVKCKSIVMIKNLNRLNKSNSAALFEEATKLQADAGLADVIEKKYDSSKISDEDKRTFYEEEAKAIESCK